MALFDNFLVQSGAAQPVDNWSDYVPGRGEFVPRLMGSLVGHQWNAHAQQPQAQPSGSYATTPQQAQPQVAPSTVPQAGEQAPLPRVKPAQTVPLPPAAPPRPVHVDAATATRETWAKVAGRHPDSYEQGPYENIVNPNGAPKSPPAYTQTTVVMPQQRPYSADSAPVAGTGQAAPAPAPTTVPVVNAQAAMQAPAPGQPMPVHPEANFAPTNLGPLNNQSARPTHYGGSLHFDGMSYKFGTGSTEQFPSIPSGNYQITPNTIGPWGRAHGAIGVNNNKIWDPKLKRFRNGIELHPGSHPQLLTKGCVAIAGSQWKEFRSRVMAHVARGEKLYLHVTPQDVSITTSGGTVVGSSVSNKFWNRLNGA